MDRFRLDVGLITFSFQNIITKLVIVISLSKKQTDSSIVEQIPCIVFNAFRFAARHFRVRWFHVQRIEVVWRLFRCRCGWFARCSGRFSLNILRSEAIPAAVVRILAANIENFHSQLKRWMRESKSCSLTMYHPIRCQFDKSCFDSFSRKIDSCSDWASRSRPEE